MSEREEFDSKKKQLSALRAQLHHAQEEKETIFQQLKSQREKIKSRILNIRNLKEERNTLTKQVQQQKEQRDKLNEEVRNKAQVQRQFSERREELRGQVPQNPGRMREEIRRLETKIETEVIPFEKEKQFRKRIKELRTELAKAEKINAIYKEASSAAADVSAARRQAETSHHSVQELAQRSQQRHETIHKLYEEVKQLRQEEKPLFGKHAGCRERGNALKKELAEISARVDELAKILHEEREKSFQVKVQEKTAEVNEKIKKGKKLSMDDILAFQATKE